jgi:hypothetical protein
MADRKRRRVSAQIAAITLKSKSGGADPRLPALRAELNDLAIAEIHAWAHKAAAALPPLTTEEIHDVAVLVRQVDARIARQAVDCSDPPCSPEDGWMCDGHRAGPAPPASASASRPKGTR